MPAFSEPDPPLDYSLATEKSALDLWFTHREVPASENGRLLLASWNVASLGNQKRDGEDLELIAHLLKRFDLIAVQEINADFAHFVETVSNMGDDFDWIINDTGGNSERLGFIYRKNRVRIGRMFAEIALPKKDFPRHSVVVPYRKSREDRVEVYFDLEFTPFDRNPFVGTFACENLDFTLVNVHLYFGAFKNSTRQEERAKYARRVLEVFTLGKWAKKRKTGKKSYDKDIILIGDMNVPEMNEDDAAFAALKKSGLKPTNFYSKTGGSNLTGSKTYDQLAITPGSIENRVLRFDVFDFDNALFKAKWEELEGTLSEKAAVKKFNQYVRFHVSDHRLLWMQLDVS